MNRSGVVFYVNKDRLPGPPAQRLILLGAHVIDAIVAWDMEDDPQATCSTLPSTALPWRKSRKCCSTRTIRSARADPAGRPITTGETSTGKRIAVIWEQAWTTADHPPRNRLRNRVERWRIMAKNPGEFTALAYKRPNRRPRSVPCASGSRRRSRTLEDLVNAATSPRFSRWANTGNCGRRSRRSKHSANKQGLSITDLAERTEMDRAMISRLENGQMDNPTIATMSRYAKALGKRVVVSLVDAVDE